MRQNAISDHTIVLMLDQSALLLRTFLSLLHICTGCIFNHRYVKSNPREVENATWMLMPRTTLVMDTPERNQINPPFSRVEDSPVFSFINSLSPIKPVKSAQIGQTFSSLSFPSPPRAFTSSNLTCFKESKVLRRHNPFGASRPGLSSEDGNKFQTSEEAIADSFHPYHNSRESQGNFHDGISVVDDSIALPGEHTDFSAEILQALNYNNCGNPGSDPGHEANSLEVFNQGLCQFDPKGQESECNWDNLISGDTDFFVFNSPNDAAFKGIMQKPDSHFMSLVLESSIYNGLRDSKLKIEDYRPEPLAIIDQMQDKHCLAMTSKTKEKPNVEVVSVMNCGTRRRCLDFETDSVQRKNSDDNLKSGSLGYEKQLVSAKRKSSSQQCIMPAVGLHLNAPDKEVISNDESSCGIHLNLPSCTSVQIYTSYEHQEPLAIEVDSSNIGPQPAKDNSHALDSTVNDVSQNSPKKKRHGDCKRCKCKKSKCLKLYCECFAARDYCTGNCSCKDCCNKLVHKDKVIQAHKQIESRNPLAFAPKVIPEPEIGNDPNKTPAPARHKRGCNCKQSVCIKKYCECFQAGVGCSLSCRCEGCKNTFGRKEGELSLLLQIKYPSESNYFIVSGANSMGVEAQLEVETEACGKVVEKASQIIEVQNSDNHPDFIPISTPFPLFSSLSEVKPNTRWSQPPKHSQAVSDQEMTDVLGGRGRSDRSPMTIKTSSPSGKRISTSKGELTISFPSPNHHR
ncbi:protein tesmin/TSO1-like CXC 2 isoform X1 [Arachis ipaensis]|uniref:protein tesmin/TSO1-like CXC 2 isoform X1 n=1 Tax=Arachis ipaensis TaxID=130454 RepID=UPI0007AEF5F7|nr:protein tesmin/TSO1-like CXC 2 isoform X1 [Arachis ipaensis]XP_016186482.1 protein tesmin/TSO1-like CXC 2 isoform X1 [Arachis ipaensis]XP_025627347.1 protein tesmin/TSO1-like CXC 2 isoform X1 [Arachis hypogaea]XP_025627348.1 protein tesmin/TSO1-like CXC 2 isoform X1 [Arachis hypogaea]XP_025627349.1 protein tesmin/TSO1-like CXC 2 isoform X1 [Arachis hypogaea]